MLFMGGNLKHAVGTGVADGLAAFDMLFAQFGDDGGAGGMFVAENAGQSSLNNKFLNQIWRKARLGFREIAPIKRHGHTCDFPMARRRILAF